MAEEAAKKRIESKEELESAPTFLETPESVSAELERIEAAADQVDKNLKQTIVEVNKMRLTAEESERVSEIKNREQGAFSKFKAFLEQLYWKVRAIGKPPEIVQAIQLIAKTQREKNKNNPNQLEILQQNLKKALSVPGEELSETMSAPMERSIKNENPFLQSFNDWHPSVENLNANDLERLIDLKRKWDEINDVYLKDPNASEEFSQEMDAPIPKNLINLLKTIFEITDLAPATDEEAKRVWALGYAGSIMRSGENNIGDYFYEIQKKYPEFEIKLNKKMTEEINAAQHISIRAELPPDENEGAGSESKTIPPPGRKNKPKPPAQTSA